MNRNRCVAFCLVLGLGSGMSSCSLFKRDASDRIAVSGNIELTQVNLAFKIPGRLIELPIEEGTRIEKGAVVARLDAVQLQQQRARDQAALSLAETQLDQQKTSIAYQKAILAADLDLRKASLRQAETRLEQLLAGSRSQEIEQARAATEEARAQNLLAGQDWERAQALYRNDDISASQRDQYKTRFDASGAIVRQAEQRLALAIEGPRKEDIEGARAQVEQAKAALRLSESAAIELKRKEQELETRRAQIDQARAQLSITEAQLQDTVITSPIGGIVLVKATEVGEVLAAGTSVASVGELDRPWLRGYISEKELGRVKLGAKVKVTTDSFPGKIYWGRISFIASQAEFTPKQIQTAEERVKLVYRIKVEIENPQHELKLNMPADGEIQLSTP